MNSQRWKVGAVTPKVVYARQPFPEMVTKTIFLAGPTPRSDAPSWRPKAIEMLAELGFDGHVFVPEPEDGQWAEDYLDQLEWEDEGLHRADCIVFWVPRDKTGEHYGGQMLGLTTNDEWGFWKDSGKVVWGAPGWAEHVRYQTHYAKKFGAPNSTTLRQTLQSAVSQVGEGARRSGGGCQVPLHIWNKPEFQGWLETQEEAGNRLDGCRVDWSFRVPSANFSDGGPPPSRLFLYALHVDMHIGSENRQKNNEVVILRPDISSVVLFRRLPQMPGETTTTVAERVLNTEIVLVREYRSPARNSEGFVYELPGGSGEDDPLVNAKKEVHEETGLKLASTFNLRVAGITLASTRFVGHGHRQVAATLAGHVCHLFSVELTSDEMAKLKADKSVHGENDEEKTYIEVWNLAELLAKPTVDWSMMGMVVKAIASSGPNPVAAG